MIMPVPKVGFLNSGTKNLFDQLGLVAAFKQGLAAFNYAEPNTVKIEEKFADGNYAQLSGLANGLVQAGVKVLAAAGGVVSAQAAVSATSSIPIVFVGGYNPNAILFQPGIMGIPPNTTGISIYTTESVPERLSVLRALLGNNTAKVDALLHPFPPNPPFVYQQELLQAQRASLTVVEAPNAGDLDGAFDWAKNADNAEGLLVCADPFFTTQRDKIVAAAKTYALPTCYPFRLYAEAGGLMSFGPNLRAIYQIAGQYVGKILNGAQPSQLPPTVVSTAEFELVINQTTANQLGLQIPQSLASRAQIIQTTAHHDHGKRGDRR
jgi:putative tryptophan/tyrosine transport system substrate-binding protein